MSCCVHKRLGKESGFTLPELLTAGAILCILSCIAIPVLSQLYPDVRLKMAARELYGNMHLAKMGAVKENRKWRIVFFPEAGRYTLWSYGSNGEWDGGSGDDRNMKTIDLSGYGSGVCFGEGAASRSATKPPGSVPEDGVSYNYNVAVFSPRGMANTLGYVYLTNDRQSGFAVGTITRAGVVVLKRWSGTDWE
jgi:prepilin-type N-terminal cleavage/methylation domain-containing protein